MRYDRLVAAAFAADGHELSDDALGLDGALARVRLEALQRGRWILDLVDRLEPFRGRGDERAAVEAEIDRAMKDAGDDGLRAAGICVVLSCRYAELRRLAMVTRRRLSWTPDEAALVWRIVLADHNTWTVRYRVQLALASLTKLDDTALERVLPDMKAVEAFLKDAPQIHGSEAVRFGRRLREAIERCEGPRSAADVPGGLGRLVPEDEPWAGPLRDLLTTSWTPEAPAFVRHLGDLTGPRPARRWRTRCLELAADAPVLREAVSACLRLLAGGDAVTSDEHGPYARWMDGGWTYRYLVRQEHGDLARGAIWAATLLGEPGGVVAELEPLALRTGGPGGDVIVDLKLAGAAINALGDVADPSALDALWRLQHAIKHRALAKQIGAAVEAAAGRQGITPEQLIERGVPRHDLDADGTTTRGLGDHEARVAVADAVTVRLTFAGPDGRPLKSAPAALREPYADEIRELKALTKQVRGTLSAERARVERLMSADRAWPFDEWSRHYRDHPVTGVLVRGLIWEFEGADGRWTAAAPGGRTLVTVDGTALADPAPGSRVRLWQPVRAGVAEIQAWRGYVAEHEIRQPFKQAFREIYLLTPAEEETRVYSNRFAAHIVHYRRLYALFKERGWQSNYLGRHEAGYHGEAKGEFGDGRWRACFFHEPAEDDFQDAPRYAATDQVRFERREGRRWLETAVADVPAAVFSEAMRDVDLFVGVTSIAADPDWTDHGEDRYLAYWQRTSFGVLSASAETRRDALRRVVPLLKFGARCTVDDRYLVVRGTLRTYKIHLGSANILMEPDDRYLCIVPARRAAAGGKVFLPFEDERLALILSKAALLAADNKITDRTILDQIRTR
ncbi:DUF4132 domain-containing protein [Spirillospora sp. NPDC047279]|uniref:DUF4132 domain-containing protein n=1 Tax=Spirillospora sp. NPDC047279 TaxID=3155478 RepID=UPI0034100000